MHRTRFTSAALAGSAVLASAQVVAAQQSDVSLTPFVSFLPSAGTSPLAGLALTLAGNGGLGLRASGHIALENSKTGLGTPGTLRPWGADVDALLTMGSRGGLMPFVFAGIGTSNDQGTSSTAFRNNWSYGAGASLPLGSALDIFGEARWRMSRYVLPTATLAPSPTNEFRVGLSFHVGGGSSSSGGGSRRPRDRRLDVTTSSRLPAAGYLVRSASSAAVAARVVGTADQYVGVPYRFGGTSPLSGFDGSGFVQYVFNKHGVRLPRTASQQAEVGQELASDWRAVSAGDLVMFEDEGRINHVAIYAGRNRIIHSTGSGGGVRYDDLSTRRGEWFADHMVAARRVTPDSRGLLLDLARSFADASSLQLDTPDRAPKSR